MLIIPQMLGKGWPEAVKSGPWREIRIQVDVPLMDASSHSSYLSLTTVSSKFLCLRRYSPLFDSAF